MYKILSPTSKNKQTKKLKTHTHTQKTQPWGEIFEEIVPIFFQIWFKQQQQKKTLNKT